MASRLFDARTVPLRIADMPAATVLILRCERAQRASLEGRNSLMQRSLTPRFDASCP